MSNSSKSQSPNSSPSDWLGGDGTSIGGGGGGGGGTVCGGHCEAARFGCDRGGLVGNQGDAKGKTKAKNMYHETEDNRGVGMGDDYHRGLGQDAIPLISRTVIRVSSPGPLWGL